MHSRRRGIWIDLVAVINFAVVEKTIIIRLRITVVEEIFFKSLHTSVFRPIQTFTCFGILPGDEVQCVNSFLANIKYYPTRANWIVTRRSYFA